MKKILCVFGTRPEAIKMAPVVLELKKHSEEFDCKVCVTGQHRKMLDQALSIFEIVPDYDLNIMQQGQDLYDITSRVLLGMRDVLKCFVPDIVLVHGDTTTSTAAALAAFYQQIQVGHVEAGLRTYNIYSPWPEEINRQITSRIATYNFAPTPLAKENLAQEKANLEHIFVTGNTVIDALLLVENRLITDFSLIEKVSQIICNFGYDLNRLHDGRKMVLITGHRRENFGDGFIHICNAIKDLAEEYKNVDFVYPVHLNPNVRKPVNGILGNNLDNVFLIEPLQYLEFVYMMMHAHLILTDSGGVQEEAPSFGKPVLVMRNTTERPEAVEAGTVKLVGTSYENIVENMRLLLNNDAEYQKMSRAINPYGDGLASNRIVKALMTL